MRNLQIQCTYIHVVRLRVTNQIASYAVSNLVAASLAAIEIKGTASRVFRLATVYLTHGS